MNDKKKFDKSRDQLLRTKQMPSFQRMLHDIIDDRCHTRSTIDFCLLSGHLTWNRTASFDLGWIQQESRDLKSCRATVDLRMVKWTWMSEELIIVFERFSKQTHLASDLEWNDCTSGLRASFASLWHISIRLNNKTSCLVAVLWQYFSQSKSEWLNWHESRRDAHFLESSSVLIEVACVMLVCSNFF
jgi:hypothetical protein